MNRNTSAQALVATSTAIQAGYPSSGQIPPDSTQGGAVEDTQPATRPAPINPQADADYADVVDEAQAGNISHAQADLAKLQIDVEQPHAHVHHVGGAVPAATQVSPDSATPTDSTNATGTGGSFLNVTV